jgi:hypothetical protein
MRHWLEGFTVCVGVEVELEFELTLVGVAIAFKLSSLSCLLQTWILDQFYWLELDCDETLLQA